MLLFLVFIPLLNFCYMWFLGLIIGKRNVLWLIAHSYVIILVLSFIGFWKVCICGDIEYFLLGSWINCGLFVVNWGFIFDSLSISMLLMVTIVSGLVHFYSIGYMESDASLLRFMSYLSLFTFFMFILVTSDNFAQLFLGWEGIGLCSYLLISFWNTRVQANKASLKAIVMNRLGDFGYLCGLVLVYFFFRSVDFSVVFVLVPFFTNVSFFFLYWDIYCVDAICFCLFIGSVGKSAQMGLHTWLPDAMEGPTPVSALIHAATLVTAGVFLIIRCSPIFEFAPIALFIILIIGGLTSFFAATIAITQNDIKKVIAYSTCSQLGYMVFICGLSSYHVSMFHLVNHAFFKALLFLGAGSVIHAMSGEQDVRKYGKLVNLIPYTYSLMLIGFISLSGLPFLSGFYSKDLILEIAFSSYTLGGVFVYWLGSISAGLTAFYSFRVFYLTFWGKNMSYKFYIQSVHELPQSMGFSLFVLAIGSILSGYVLKDSFVGAGSIFWSNSIFILSKNSSHLDCEFIPLIFKNLPLIFSFLGIFLALIFNNIFLKINKNIQGLTIDVQTKKNQGFYHNSTLRSLIKVIWFLNNKWYFDYVYNYYIGFSILKHGYETFYKLIDKGFIEICGVQGLSSIVYKLALILSRKQSGYIYNSASLLVLSTFFVLCILLAV
jgi:proton-translocating NADH-quinone oxidoreductase chain L